MSRELQSLSLNSNKISQQLKNHTQIHLIFKIIQVCVGKYQFEIN